MRSVPPARPNIVRREMAGISANCGNIVILQLIKNEFLIDTRKHLVRGNDVVQGHHRHHHVNGYEIEDVHHKLGEFILAELLSRVKTGTCHLSSCCLD